MLWTLVDENGGPLERTSQGGPAAGAALADEVAADDQLAEALRSALVRCAPRAVERAAGTRRRRYEFLPIDGPGAARAIVLRHELDAPAERGRLALRNDAILRSAMDGYFVVGEDLRFVEVNDAFARMMGYSPEELLTKRACDLEVAEAGTHFALSQLRTGLHHFPTAHRHKTGRLVYLEISITVLRDNNERLLVGFARDVTERRRAEEEFARLSRRHKLILDSSIEGIVGVDRDGRATFVNPAATELLGVGPGGLLGRSLHAVFGCRDEGGTLCGDTSCTLCSVLRLGVQFLPRESQFRRHDGSALPVEYSITPMYERDRVIGAVLIFRDIRERKRAEEERRALELQVLQAQRLESLGLLAGGIAHDLNNMLVGILGNACLALNQLDDRVGLRERVQRIISASERASKVIRQILAYSGQVQPEIAEIDLNELVADLGEFMRAAIPRNIALDVQLHDAALRIEADSGQLQQVITNLIVNAAEAIGTQNGRISVSAGAGSLELEAIARNYPGQNLSPGRYAELSVNDDGCGMAPETLARIFEPFFSQKGTGRGLGLAATRGVLRAHRAGIRVESTLGAGTTFTIAFPLMEASVTHAPRGESNAGGNGELRRILVIDDDDAVREVLKDMLEARGAQVQLAADGSDGVRQFEAACDEIDLVILDATMPGMSGAEVLDRLLQIRPGVRVLVASGYGEQNLAERFPAAQPSAFLRKPFTAQALFERIEAVLT